jgi:hypothetical protein
MAHGKSEYGKSMGKSEYGKSMGKGRGKLKEKAYKKKAMSYGPKQDKHNSKKY